MAHERSEVLDLDTAGNAITRIIERKLSLPFDMRSTEPVPPVTLLPKAPTSYCPIRPAAFTLTDRAGAQRLSVPLDAAQDLTLSMLTMALNVVTGSLQVEASDEAREALSKLIYSPAAQASQLIEEFQGCR
jgi:hypothetical protein